MSVKPGGITGRELFRATVAMRRRQTAAGITRPIYTTGAERPECLWGKQKKKKAHKGDGKMGTYGSRYEDLFTEEVVTRWYQEWYRQGKSLGWIAKNNGVAETSGRTIKKYFQKYGLEIYAKGRGVAVTRREPRPALEPAAQPAPRADGQIERVLDLMRTLQAEPGLDLQVVGLTLDIRVHIDSIG